MDIKTHEKNGMRVAEVISDTLFLKDTADGLALLGDLYYQGFDRMILHKKNLSPDFFILKNGFAGDLLQKFSNYRMRLAIVGEFEKYDSTSIRAFIFESNKTGQINFLESISAALDRLSQAR